jgi:hypothetical protein
MTLTEETVNRGLNAPFGRRFGTVLAAVSIVAGSTSTDGQGEHHISCLPDRSVALPTDQVRLNVWVSSSGAPIVDNVAATWTVSAGRLDERSRPTTWTVAGVPVDRRYTATVNVQVNGVAAGACTLGVWVAAPLAPDVPSLPGGGIRLRGEYVTRRAFIRSGQVGEAGFGLYSYFLMREPATPSERSRAAAFVKAFLDVLVGVADQENYVERGRLNGSYLPVTADPPQGLSSAQWEAWVLEHYDFEHARRLLSYYPTLNGSGPFILAMPAPLRTTVRPMLPWDFSVIPDTAIPDGVSRFLNQAAQLYDWQNQNALEKLRNELLTAVAAMFVGRSAAENRLSLIR